MKITGLYGPQMLDPSKKDEKVDGEKTQFREIMQGVLAEPHAQLHPGTVISGPPPVHGPRALGTAEQVLSPAAKAVSEVQDMLDVLDFYATRLADESFSTQDLEGLVRNMWEKISELDYFRSENDIPPALDTIISDLVATISSEVEKFNRGDYS